MSLSEYLYNHQQIALEEQKCHEKCLINMWCGTGKTRTFTIGIFSDNQTTNVIVFPSLGLITQYCNDYILSHEEPFVSEFKKYKCLAFCSDDESKLKIKTDKIQYTTKEKTLNTFLKQKTDKIILVTYQSFEKFINQIIERSITINNLIFDEAHHIVGDKIQNIVFYNEELDECVEKMRYYTATPVNKNGITMYDRDEPDNSDCGPLAYEYLYYQAVQEGVCKSFETQICLYTQKKEYTNKYQPIFECIIRACLSGNYDYWNILTYHSFVNESENVNQNVSFVKDFACKQNQDFVKKVFTKIQNEEFPHTKNLYSVDDVILKGVHSDTPNRQKTIDEFDKKVVGRIYILASCGILNEGIDTKWANMGVPINPTNSIVKESQRIGRLGRIPEENMPPAIILIPCMVDARKYASMDTAEQRDQMIRKELSECGNFNTAMNVISAFKYQYDPELFEMCLMYPNKYAPQEVKSNLEKQGLIVEESKGDLLDNLSYVCEKEDIEIKKDIGEGDNESILNEIAELTKKTIEVHTQNHDEPIMYINGEVSDEEPLRLFYCEDDKTYAPIVKKDKTRNIKRKSTSPPKKRSRLFDVHTHPDLEVLWKISESSIDLNKSFSQSILDVDITWKEKKWMENYNILKELDEIPIGSYKTEDGVNIGGWCERQRYNKKKKNLLEDRIVLLEKVNGWIWEVDHTEKWNKNFEKLKDFINNHNRTPSSIGKETHEKVLGKWLSHQLENYKNKVGSMKNREIRIKWEELINDSNYKDYFKCNLDKWFDTLKSVKIFMDENKKRPPSSSNVKHEQYLGSWIGTQIKNYNDKQEIMSNQEIYEQWKQFINDTKYEEYFKSNKEIWHEKFDKLKSFIDENDKMPTNNSKNLPEKELFTWLHNAITNYNQKRYIMKEKDIFEKWENFINDSKYKYHFLSNEERWLYNLANVKLYIDKYGKKPSQNDKDKNVKYLGKWIGTQNGIYDKKLQIMQNKEIYEKWREFINDPKYKKHFKTYQELWLDNLEKLKIFIDKNNKLPSTSMKKNENEKYLSQWYQDQNKYYKSNSGCLKEKKIYEKWREFINDPKYKKYFSIKEEIWYDTFEKLKCYIDKHNKRPSQNDKDICIITLANWFMTQVENYDKKNNIMKNKNIYEHWSKFIDDSKYKEYFMTNGESWLKSFKKLKTFIDENNKRPNNNSKDSCEKRIAQWMGTQTKNYDQRLCIMNEQYIYEHWSKFINDSKYKQYFSTNEEIWYDTLKKIKTFIDQNNKIPYQKSDIKSEKTLGYWIGTQKQKYKKKTAIMQNKQIYERWGEFINDPKYKKYFKHTKNMSKPEIKPKTIKETKKQQRVQSEMSLLHKEYKTKTSQNLHEYFKDNPTKWEDYHKISKDNEESFPDDEIPRNKMIKHLEGLPGKKKKIIADLGCGFAEINQHFKDNERFEFHNFDHHSSNEFVVSRDIKDTGLDDYSVDIAILSLAMWGSNCKEYLSESHRILDTGGTLLIVEAYKRWNKELDEYQKPINRLVKLLEENNFDVVKNNEQKFMFIECRKK